jgi:hypothetical protein
MATHFLDQFVRELESDGEVDSGVCLLNQPWYNKHGDCVQFKLSGDAYYAERVDEFLTIFRHHEDDRPIGFQIKSVATLLQTLPIDGLRVEAEVTEKVPAKVSLSSLLLLAFRRDADDSPERLDRYSEVLRSRPVSDEVEILVAA